MCWQAISMKDPNHPMSQELLEAVEQERNVQENRARSTAVFRHPILGDFVVPAGADDAELEERIMQHLAAAAAVRRSHRHARREARRSRSAAHGHSQIIAFSATGATSGDSVPPNSQHERDSEHSPVIISAPTFAPVTATEETVASTSSLHDTTFAYGPFGSDNRVSVNRSLPDAQDGAGPSDFQSFSETFKSHLQSVSTKYKDSITNNTRGWTERWFTQNNTISNLGSEVKREVNAGIAAVSRMMERLETRDGTGPSSTPGNVHSVSGTHNPRAVPSECTTAVNGASSSATRV